LSDPEPGLLAIRNGNLTKNVLKLSVSAKVAYTVRCIRLVGSTLVD